MILAGDIGGTKVNMALLEPEGRGYYTVKAASYHSQSFRGLNEIVEEFLAKDRPVFEKACFGIAGPVNNREVITTNLPWNVSADGMERALHIPQVELINDVEANAYGIFTLGEDDFCVLHPGERGIEGNGVVVSAGTGLGEAGLYWNGRIYLPFACEGGHADFSPRTEEQVELWRYLKRNHGEVSWEHVLSGQGQVNLYKFARERSGVPEPDWLAEAMKAGDPAPVITGAALSHRDEVCMHAVDLFVSCYAVECANMALKLLARNGVYIGGGIAPKILPRMNTDVFRKAFVGDGKMSSLLEKIPVKVILNDKTALRGAAFFAQYRMGPGDVLAQR
jgi:glucokinase